MFSIPDYVQSLVPYKAGNQVEFKEFKSPLGRMINFASNENPFGGSPKARQAIIDTLSQIALYPDPTGEELTIKLSKKLGIKPEELVFAHGSESIISHFVNAFSNVGEEIVTASSTFVGIFVSVNKYGRKIKKVPMRDYTFDLHAILDAISDNTKIVYLANPNNPTGTMFRKDEFEWFMERVPTDKLVVLDEAYYSYSSMQEGYPDGLNYHYPNLLKVRTFSKTHGLAGLRVGYAFGPEELVSVISRIKLAFEPSILAQKAAIAAIDDDEYVEQSVKVNSVALKLIASKFDELGIYYPEPVANFLMIVFPNDIIAKEFSTECLRRGVITRFTGSFGFDQGVRISTGTLEETEYAISVFDEVINLLKRKYQL
jgi:histidinol-phosphate aminotransferase